MLPEVPPILDCLKAAIQFWSEFPDSRYATINVRSIQKLHDFYATVAKKKMIFPKYQEELKNIMSQLHTMISPNSIYYKNNPSEKTLENLEIIGETIEAAELAMEELKVKKEKKNKKN